MPKKTREQKIMAEKRRLLQITTVPQVLSTPNLSIKDYLRANRMTAGQSWPQSITTSVLKTKSAREDMSYIKHDVFRIAIITTALLVTEGVLFYLLEIRRLFF